MSSSSIRTELIGDIGRLDLADMLPEEVLDAVVHAIRQRDGAVEELFSGYNASKVRDPVASTRRARAVRAQLVSARRQQAWSIIEGILADFPGWTNRQIAEEVAAITKDKTWTARRVRNTRRRHEPSSA